MTPVDRAAYVSIGKASGFALLAIFCTAFGFLYQPPLSAFVAGVLCLSLAVVLRGFARWTWMRPYRRTETWLLIREEDRPPPAIAQRVVEVAMRSAYLWFARQTATWGVACLTISIALDIAGLDYLTVNGDTAAYLGETRPFLDALVDPQPFAVP